MPLSIFSFFRSARKHVRETAVKTREFAVGPYTSSTSMPTQYSLHRELPAVCQEADRLRPCPLCLLCVHVQPPLPPPSRALSICALHPPPSTADTATRCWLCQRGLGLARPAPCTATVRTAPRCLRTGSPVDTCGEWMLIICPFPSLCAGLFSENEEGAKICRQCGQKKSEQKAICGV